jgi:hypothetical protein
VGGAGSHLAAAQILSDVLDGVDAAAEEHDGRVDPPLVRDERDELAHLGCVPVVRDRRGAQHEKAVVLGERGVGELALERLEDLVPLRARVLVRAWVRVRVRVAVTRVT